MKYIYLIIVLFLISCVNSEKDNNQEMKKLSSHYSMFSEQHKVAKYIADNIYRHTTTVGKAVGVFRDSLYLLDSGVDLRTSPIIDSLWGVVSDGSRPHTVPHSEVVSSQYLINDIDFAFDIWQKSPWKDSVSFDVFKEFIAPYSISSEPIVAWREKLYNKYVGLIKGIQSPKEAFDIVYYNIKTNFKLGDPYAFVADPLILDRTMRGSCSNRSLYITAVMRSLSIPCAYDFISNWVNYLGNGGGHAWVSYVGNGDEIYTMYDYDSISYRDGRIDGTAFPPLFEFDENAPYKVDSLKKIAKIWRISYSQSSVDVSGQYNYREVIDLKTKERINSDTYLCVFKSGGGFNIIDGTKVRGRNVKFVNIARDVTYFIGTFDRGDFMPLSNPITIYPDGRQVTRDPQIDDTEKVILRRKYLLLSLWAPNRWRNYIGVTFEGSDYKDFSVADTLHLVKEMPWGITNADVRTDKAYRYVRVSPPDSTRRSIAEASFYGVDENGTEVELKGKVIYDRIDKDKAYQLFDKDYMTATYSKLTHHWVGYDLGVKNKIKVSRVSFCPWNDGNIIESGDEYELLYYDMGWHSLGKKVATKEYLEYDNAPKNAVLWLRNLTKGNEERIFTYENNKQVWW